MYDTRRELDHFDVLRDHEIEAGVEALSRGTAAHEALSAAINPARDRWLSLPEDQQDDFRDALRRFTSIYRFLAQVVDFTDINLERDYLYCKALDSTLPGQDSERLDLGSEVKLTHLRVEQTFEGSASLKTGGGELESIYSGRGPQYDPDAEHLSQIVDEINERFGLDLGETDQLLFDQYESEWLDDDTLAAQARGNDLANFRLVFDRKFMNTIVRRMDSNEEIFKKILDDNDFKSLLFDFYAARLFGRFRGD